MHLKDRGYTERIGIFVRDGQRPRVVIVERVDDREPELGGKVVPDAGSGGGSGHCSVLLVGLVGGGGCW